MMKNDDVLDRLIVATDCDNPNQFAAYLSEKYGIDISRQKIHQFKKSNPNTITHLLLREALELAAK